MSKKRKFIKLGEKAYGFSDPWSRFDISGKQIKELETLEQRRSNKIRAALRGGHLQEATEKEFEEYQDNLVKGETSVGKENGKDLNKEESLREELSEMTKAALLAYYKDNYEVSPEDIKSFDKLNHDERVDELVELADIDNV